MGLSARQRRTLQRPKKLRERIAELRRDTGLSQRELTKRAKKRSEEIGKRIADLRRDAGLSQPELAQMIGSRALTVWRWEHGKAAHIDNFAALATALRTSIDWLYFGPSEPRP